MNFQDPSPERSLSLPELIANLNQLVANELLTHEAAWSIAVKHAATTPWVSTGFSMYPNGGPDPFEPPLADDDRHTVLSPGVSPAGQALAEELNQAGYREPLRNHVHEDTETRLASVERRLAAVDNRSQALSDRLDSNDAIAARWNEQVNSVIEQLDKKLQEWGHAHATRLDGHRADVNRIEDYLTELHERLARPSITSDPSSLHPQLPALPW